MSDFFRGRRLRRTPTLRAMLRETELRPADVIQPYFVVEHADPKFIQPVGSMPGVDQLGLAALVERVGRAVDKGLASVILFGLPAHKDPAGTQGYAENGIVQQATRALKKRFPALVVVTDVCLCEYTSHGHCGLLVPGPGGPGGPAGEMEVENDATLELLARTALSHAQAGADVVAPSDMMDGRVLAIREALDAHGFSMTPILSYAVKYASAFYGPFRDAAQSAPQSGDRKAYQMDPANRREALREAAADAMEGADMLMVKPAMPYLDILRDLRENFDLPLCAYQVSGEYAMLKAAILQGWLDEERAVLESLTGIKRAGADLIITYFAEDVLGWIG